MPLPKWQSALDEQNLVWLLTAENNYTQPFMCQPQIIAFAMNCLSKQPKIVVFEWFLFEI